MNLNIGIVGLGAAGHAFIAPLQKHSGFNWVAFAESDTESRHALAQEYGVAAYGTLTQMLAHSNLHAVYIATPTPLHCEQVLEALAAGKHVLVEKPMAITLQEARTMVSAAQRANVQLLVGHSHSYDLPIARMREVITSGELGAVRMVNTWCYTDWVYRPRRPDELETAQGGGTLYRQGAHQIDVLRLLCGGQTRSVRAQTFNWDPQRQVIGAHMLMLEFENGVAASAVYNGYGGLSSMDLCFDISEWGEHQPASSRKRPQRLVTGASSKTSANHDAAQGLQEAQAKQARAKKAIPVQAPFQPFFGLTVVSCERGDIRQSPTGLIVSTLEGQREIALPTDQSPRDLVVAEFFNAIAGERTAVHSARWGLANLEVCVAALESASSGKSVVLKEQVSA